MLRGHLFHRVPALVIVPPTGDSQKLPPLVDARSPVGVHRAVNGHCWNTRLMGPGDPPDVVRRLCVGEALVVDHHIEALGPIGLIVEGDLGSCARATFADDGPFHSSVSGYGIGERECLKRIIVAASARDEQRSDRPFCGHGGMPCTTGQQQQEQTEQGSSKSHGHDLAEKPHPGSMARCRTRGSDGFQRGFLKNSCRALRKIFLK